MCKLKNANADEIEDNMEYGFCKCKCPAPRTNFYNVLGAGREQSMIFKGVVIITTSLLAIVMYLL